MRAVSSPLRILHLVTHMFMVAYFGIRPFQDHGYEAAVYVGEYLRLRLMTCGAALVAGLLCADGDQPGLCAVKAATECFLMVAYKVIDGFVDAYEAEFQRDGRLYLTGKSKRIPDGFYRSVSF